MREASSSLPLFVRKRLLNIRQRIAAMAESWERREEFIRPFHFGMPEWPVH
jgi:hypothetical protein